MGVASRGVQVTCRLRPRQAMGRQAGHGTRPEAHAWLQPVAWRRTARLPEDPVRWQFRYQRSSSRTTTPPQGTSSSTMSLHVVSITPYGWRNEGHDVWASRRTERDGQKAAAWEAPKGQTFAGRGSGRGTYDLGGGTMKIQKCSESIVIDPYHSGFTLPTARPIPAIRSHLAVSVRWLTLRRDRMPTDNR